MKPLFLIQEALQAMRSNMLRSVLTIVGIIVGIFSVTAMLALGQGLSDNIANRFNSLIAGDITVSGVLTQNDLAWIKSQNNVAAASGAVNVGSAKVVAQGTAFSPNVKAVLGDYSNITSLTFVSGAPFDFTDSTYGEKVVIVDEGFQAAVLKATSRPVASTSITINGQQFAVIGVISGGTGGFGRRSDGSILIPYAATVGTLTGTNHFSSISVKLINNQYYEIVAKAITEGLNTSRGAVKDSSDYFSVSSAQDAINTALSTIAMISIFLGIVGGIALFVGGIGTMNMMLTTVTERTKEIGLRKAIGARNKDILLQILVESVTLTFVGGVIGIVLTYGVSIIANNILAASGTSVISLVLSWKVVAYATLVSLVVGVVFGLYPARRASLLQPVDALRAD
jgi:putative ABC transport system permease protein